ncbi:hypothetical protein [Aquabacterium sp.]|uniref:hypothetical protein n=1 Tax=Aquabacterium sp. TaxID=1872578 RepID=UPI003D6CB069
MNTQSDERRPVAGLSRRRFTAALGGVSTLAGMAPLALHSQTALAQSTSPSRLERLNAMLNLFARDTLAGVSAFAVPGSDLYSLVQGQATLQAGGMAAKNDAFLVFMFDNYLPLPPPLGSSLSTSLGAPLRGISLPLGDGTTLNVGAAVTELLDTRDSLPLATIVALLLNAVALTVRPSSIVGPFLSPFSRLSWKDKARVLELFENPGTEVLGAMGNVPTGLIKTVLAYVQLIAVGLLAFAGFGSYSEWAFLDPATRQLRSRPVGWTLSRYQPNGPVEGWDEFRGYYQDRRSASDA